ncbi:MAG TPA: alpha/beta hydrolase, partial [Candidatus Hydrogenedentes bacterium]|nr:alpha/beta hydrolase [Candidatus Hydrogenedentota bacterium]
HSRDLFRMHDTAVRAAALFFPPTDLVDYGGREFVFFAAEGPHLIRLLVEAGAPPLGPKTFRKLLEALSPARQVRAAPPPFLLIHGDADVIVPVSQSEKLADAVRAAGGTADLIIKPGGGHPWPDIRNEIERMADWLAAHLQ